MVKISLEQFSKVRVLVAGDVMLDRYLFGDTNRISPEAPVSVVQIDKISDRLGGAANVAHNIVALGSMAVLLGVIGKDESGKCLIDLLKSGGVEDYLEVDEQAPTIVKLRVIARQQQLIRLDFEKRPGEKSLAHKLTRYENLVANADVVVLSDYGKGALSQVALMIEQAKAHGKMILVDPKGNDYEKYRGATILTPNQSELRQIVGRWVNEEDLTYKAQELRQHLNLEALLLTRSEEGMSLYSAEGVSHIKTQAREIFDVSGAGDTVIATLAVALAAKWPIQKAMELANRAGGVVVSKLGTAIVNLEELQ